MFAPGWRTIHHQGRREAAPKGRVARAKGRVTPPLYLLLFLNHYFIIMASFFEMAI